MASLTFLVLLATFTWKLRLRDFCSSTVSCLVFASWLSIGVLSIVINIANILGMQKDTFDYVVTAMMAFVTIVCWTVKRDETRRENWLVNIALLAMTSLWAFFVIKVGVCDAVSCDTINHLAHLKQFQLSEEISLANYSISSSLPNDVNYLAYAGATYLVLIDVFSLWFGISHETVFYSILPIFSCITAVSGAYILASHFYRRSSISVSSGLLAAVFSAFIFSVYHPVIFAGYPQLWSIAYPSSLANFTGMLLLGTFLFAVDRNSTSSISLSVLFLITMAVVPLHSGFSIIAGIIVGLFWLVSLAESKGDLRLSSPLNSSFMIFLIGWVMSVVPKLLAIRVFQESGLPDITAGIEIPLLTNTDVGMMFKLTIFSQYRVALLAFAGLSCLLLFKSSAGVIRKAELTSTIKVYCVVLASYLLLFTPYLTDFLVSLVSFAVLVRLHWFTDLLLLVVSASLFIIFVDTLRLNSLVRHCLVGLLVFSFMFFGARELNRHFETAELSKKGWPSFGLLTRSEVLSIPQYRRYLESIPRGVKYLIYNRGTYDGSTKHIELGLINGQMIQPIYVFSDTDRAIRDRCSISADMSAVKIEQLLTDCNPDYIIVWEWPNETRDPFVASTYTFLDKAFSLELKKGGLININIHKVNRP